MYTTPCSHVMDMLTHYTGLMYFIDHYHFSAISSLLACSFEQSFFSTGNTPLNDKYDPDTSSYEDGHGVLPVPTQSNALLDFRWR